MMVITIIICYTIGFIYRNSAALKTLCLEISSNKAHFFVIEEYKKKQEIKF